MTWMRRAAWIIIVVAAAALAIALGFFSPGTATVTHGAQLVWSVMWLFGLSALAIWRLRPWWRRRRGRR
jgi:hypothetical protein